MTGLKRAIAGFYVPLRSPEASHQREVCFVLIETSQV
jgi:hypothetical protein